ncbi:hypothetical protein SCH4B_0266 [Ruegeria sp. TrichCH4B]|nr:hypothetical protein SCH4B_0266 [Ruegeria sp. TrichCH4B]
MIRQRSNGSATEFVVRRHFRAWFGWSAVYMSDFKGLPFSGKVVRWAGRAAVFLWASPDIIIFHVILAILLANATAASFGDLRLSRSISQGEAFLPLPALTCRSNEVAPTTRVLRRASSPARVVTPGLTLPAVE